MKEMENCLFDFISRYIPLGEAENGAHPEKWTLEKEPIALDDRKL
jgi:hypothetical protein